MRCTLRFGSILYLEKLYAQVGRDRVLVIKNSLPKKRIVVAARIPENTCWGAIAVFDALKIFRILMKIVVIL